MQLEFDVEKCLEAKKLCGNRKSGISYIWKSMFAPSNKIGNCTNLYRILKPKNYLDFYQKYIRYAEQNKSIPITDRGLTYEELYSLSEKYKQVVENKLGIIYPVETFFYDAVCHIIVETFNGQHREAEFVRFLTSLGYKCSKFDGKTDTRYGVDIKVERGDGKVSAIQIKPISFLYGNKSDLQEDRIGLCERYEKTLNDFNIKTYYAIYSSDLKTGETEWVKNGNGFRFKINELFQYDPNDIRGTFTRCQIPKITEKLPI